jgi:hypothetical protein
MRTFTLVLIALAGCSVSRAGIETFHPNQVDGGVDAQPVAIQKADALPIVLADLAPDALPGSDVQQLGPDSRSDAQAPIDSRAIVDLRPPTDATPTTCLQQVIDNGYASAQMACAGCTDTKYITDNGYTNCESACKAEIDCFAKRGCAAWSTGDTTLGSCTECHTMMFQGGAPWIRNIIAPYCPTFFSF